VQSGHNGLRASPGDAKNIRTPRPYEEGRLLLIGTSDLDAQTPVIWNIGAIARSGHPRALDTIRRILLASAAIPGAFPPTLFDVTLDGVAYQEMHVDGGAFAQAFLYPAGVTRQRRARMAGGQRIIPATAFVIRNGRLDAEWADTQRSTMGIASRAIATMIAASGINDVIRMYNATQRTKLHANGHEMLELPSLLQVSIGPPFVRDDVRLFIAVTPDTINTGQPMIANPISHLRNAELQTENSCITGNNSL
jgi:predicted acylesterase/phospholipase RssA